MDIDLSFIEKYSLGQLLIFAVVLIFIIAVICLVINNGIKWVLILVLINCAVWYFVFGVKVTSLSEFFTTLITAWKSLLYGLQLLILG